MPHKSAAARKAYQQAWHARNRDQHLEQMAEWRRANDDPAARRAASQRHRHGKNIAEHWAAMWKAQAGRCYLCRDDLVEGEIHIDHDHDCCPAGRSCVQCRRGLACNRCNQAIGLAGDDPDRLRRMADNLEAAQQIAKARMAALPVQLVLPIGV